MSRTRGTKVLLLLLLPLLATTAAWAQNTGKLTGVVTDAATGEPLPGANVSLVGTQLGTITDVNGEYFILGVPVGTYDVQASFVGFSTETVAGVEINNNATREIDFDLSEGVELQEIVVQYERPIIQKDAVGVPRVATSEEIINLPVRGVQDVAAIQAGVVSEEGSSGLNIRGGRSGEVTYFIDGVKVIGSVALPQSAIQEQEMLIGNISAKYGDVMSGVINVTTKSGAPNFFGSLEGITSEGLDAYGYNLASGTLGGPLVSNKVSFFLAGEYLDQADGNPRSLGQFRVDEAVLDDLRQAPLAFGALDAEGNPVYLPIPRDLPSGSELVVDDDGVPVIDNRQLKFSDGTTITVPEGVDPNSIGFSPVNRAEVLPTDAFFRDAARISNGYNRMSIDGNIQLTPVDNVRLRVGGRYIGSENESLNNTLRDGLFAPENFEIQDVDNYQIYGTWTQYLSNSTFFQVQADWTKYQREDYDPDIGTDFQSFLDGYGAIENYPALQGYKNVRFRNETRVDADGNEITVRVPVYENAFRDGPSVNNETVGSLVTPVGGQVLDYDKWDNSQLRFTAQATTQIGLHQIEFGGEYEQRTNRYWGISPRGLARYFADGDAEAIAADDDRLNPDGYARYEDVPLDILDVYAGGFGFDLRGQNKVDSEDLEAFVDSDRDKPLSAYNVAPYEPLYYGGYIQDKIEFRDIVLNLGMRVDVFDNNTRVFKDPFTRRPIERASAVADRPGSIDDDYAVYYSGDRVVGYRDLEGTFYNATGEQVQASEVTLAGAPRLTSSTITEDLFEDYEPQVTFMPRIGVSFPVTDQALFFASYGVISQRPSERTYATLAALEGTGRINNTALEPEKTTQYELGFRQRLGARAALTVSGFFKQVENLIQLRDIPAAFPSAYSTYENVDFSTTKGAEFAFDLRRTNGVSANVNYTLSFAKGTGSSATTTSTIVWISETPPNFISPLAFDQRHTFNAQVDYRLGEDEGPSVFGARLLQNFGANVLLSAGSGFPYTAQVEPFNVRDSKAPGLKGGINEEVMPWWTRIDLRLDRRFPLSDGTNLSAFLNVTNLLDTNRIQDVWRATGLANNDGFLATTEGQQFLNAGLDPDVRSLLYQHRTGVNFWYGAPRQTRIGFRLDF